MNRELVFGSRVLIIFQSSIDGARAGETDELVTPLVDHEQADLTAEALLAQTEDLERQKETRLAAGCLDLAACTWP